MSTSSAGTTDPYATFRPRIGAWVGRLGALASVLVFGAIAFFGPSSARVSTTMAVLDRGLILGFGVLMAVGLWRYGQLRAVPSAEGLLVVNLLRRHQLEWAQILRVGYAGGSAWAVLELTDTEEVAVMAIQSADGQRARAEASRLAALVAHHQQG